MTSAISSCGTQLTIKRARTEIGNQRNQQVREAEKLIKESEQSSGNTVKIEWLKQPRTITVDAKTAFTQAKDELCGNLCGAFSALALP